MLLDADSEVRERALHLARRRPAGACKAAAAASAPSRQQTEPATSNHIAVRPGIGKNPGMASLRDLFLAALPAECQAAFASEPELEAALTRLLARAAAPWPTITLTPEVFLPFLAARQRAGEGLAALEELNVIDLYLACGCSARVEAAAEEFSRRLFPEVNHALAALEVPREVVEDVRQGLFDRLFLGDERQPARIRHYRGEGDLVTWIRVVVVRYAIDLLRRGNRELPTDQLPELAAREEDPELRYLKQRYGEEFKVIFEEVLASLSAEERNLLRYQLVERLTLEQIAALHSVNRSTVVRWFQKLREKLLSRTRKGLERRLRISRTEFESVMRLIQSQLHVSLQRLLE